MRSPSKRLMGSRTKRQLAAGQRRTLRAMRERMLNMARQWEDVDQFGATVLEELADRCEQTAIDLHDDTPAGADI